MSTLTITSDGPVLWLSGEFDVRSTAAVRGAITALLDEREGEVVLDVGEVVSVDPTALRVVAAASRRALGNGRHLVVRGAHGPVLRMLYLTHLIRWVDLEREPIAV